MLHGIQGLLKEKYIDLSDHIKTELDAELLKRTPAAFLGSCRYKLPEIHENREVYDKIFEILDKLDIEVFIYIGGNDSMDTIKKLSDYAIIFGHAIRFIGCPKTIDNDLALTDHTPGYGSAAKYIGTSMKEIIRDSFCLEYEKRRGIYRRNNGKKCRMADRSGCIVKGRRLRIIGSYLSAGTSI